MIVLRKLFVSMVFLCAWGNSHAFSTTAVCVGDFVGGDGFTDASCNTTFFSGTTRASADLASGSISSYSRNEGVPLLRSAGGGFEDEVTIVGLAPGQTQSITTTLHVRGNFGGESDDTQPSMIAQLIAGFPVLSNSEGAAIAELSYDGTNVTLDDSRSLGSYNVFIDSLAPSAVDITLAAFVNVSALDPTFILSADITTIADARIESTIVESDFGNTAFLSIDLPPGLSFTSVSGVLLTAPIPVPPAIWLFGSGLIGLIGVARRKNA